MQAGIELAFTLSGTLRANPRLSDYIHRIDFLPEGEVDMLDAAGHSLLSRVHGCYELFPVDQRTIRVRFFDLVEWHPYKDVPVRALETCQINVTREEDLFAFRGYPGTWITKETPPDEWPCSIFWARYVFELDPLTQLAENRRGSAYHYLMIEPDTRFYYSENDWDYEAVSVADVAAMGLEFQPEASPRPEHRGKGIVLGYR
ncbi:MAG TPA: hypothetical protein VHD63_08675 [Ktedonobacteraceae bacterium]|nr:hypothetical protein [Ktedonobacteraceae bacterium]